VFFEWAASNGLDLAKVKEMWGSFAVNSKMNRAKTLAQNYQVDSTPMVFVDGKFRPVFGPGSIEFKDAGAALDFLVAKARSERKK
jgi:thiol:disulfide interchange protein DsbA